MSIVHIGIDLAKNVFAVHGVDEHGKPALVLPAVKTRRDALERGEVVGPSREEDQK